MTVRHEPKITTGKDDYTKITFCPDLPRFGMTHIDEDLEALLRKRVYDMAGILRDVKVYLNDVRINLKSFKSYVELYVKNPLTTVFHEINNDRWEICITASEGQFTQVSFVNSICTYKGGTHVTHVVDQVVSSIGEFVNKKSKEKDAIKPFQIKSHLWVFINCLVENPAFDSQTKENMTLKASLFGSKCSLTDDTLKKRTPEWPFLNFY